MALSSLLARRLSVMCCIALVLLFAAVQGASLMDRIQHGGNRMLAHPHVALNFFDFDHDERHSHAEAPAGKKADSFVEGMKGPQDRDGDGARDHAHHHHNADHGSSLPALSAEGAEPFRSTSDRLAIPYSRSLAPAAMRLFERPPKPASAA